MAYIYLFNLYDKIDRHLNEAKQLLENQATKPDEQSYQEGRIAVLNEFRQYLSANMDDKLPKRMKKKLKEPE